MTPNLLLAHPTGHTFFRAAARAFYSVGWLRELHSCICWDPHSRISRILPKQFADQLHRRSFVDVPFELQHSYPIREIGRLSSASIPLPLAWLRRHEFGPLSVDGVFRSFDRHVADRLHSSVDFHAVYCYEDAALQTFTAARNLGVRRIYDLPIGYWRAARQIFDEERELQPEWSTTLTGLKDSPAKLERKDKELQLADVVVVPSSFVRSTLIEHSAVSVPIKVVPFGSPTPSVYLPEFHSHSGPLRVLYVGSLGQRKGLSYALDAVAALGSQVSLTLIGRPTSSTCQPLTEALGHHRHLCTLPHYRILEEMRRHDVLLFPTLFDGFGLVITEALSQGLPVITTVNSGSPECIRDGVEGFIVPIRNSNAIAQRLQQLIDDKDLLETMRHACLRRAAELSWSEYEAKLVHVVGNLLSPSTLGAS